MINLLSFSGYAQIGCKLGIAYRDIYRKGNKNKNDLTPLKPFSNLNGIYFFTKYEGTVLYVGEAHEQSLKDRIAQHFQEGTGGLRYKLKDSPTDLEELGNSILYIFPIENEENSIKAIEATLIRLYKPKFNDNLK